MDKTEKVIFQNNNISFQKSGQRIILKTQTKYQGLVLNEHLTWSAHTDILKKSKPNIWSSFKTEIQSFAESFDHYILSTFCFTSFIWLSNMGPIKKSINEAIKLQRKAIRIITFNNQFALTEPLFKEQKMLPFHKMI